MRFEELSHMMQKLDPKPDTYEAGMAQNQLLKIGSHAIRLHNMIDDGSEMESWVAKKIDLASNYVKSVHGYTAGSKAGAYDDDGMSEARLQSNWAVSFQMPKGNHRSNSFASQDDAEKFADTVKSKDGIVDSVKLRLGKNADDLSTSIRSLGEDTAVTDKEIKMAKGIAFDKRNKDNMSKATSTIEKVRKGLSQQPDVADALRTANEDAGFNVDAWSTEKVKEFGPDLMLLSKGKPIEMPGYDSYGMELDDGRPDDDEGNVAADDSIGGEVTNAIRGHRDSLENSKFSMADYDRVKPNAATIKYAQNIINSPEFKKAYNSTESVSEDAGEGHMSKSQLYQTAKMAIELLDMINKGDDLEGWVQTKLNLAADYLQAVYHYEDYQKLNPYREELDGALMQKHAGVIQKNLDEILARETETADVDTKPGMMRILKKRVNEVEKEIAKENRKQTDESQLEEGIKEWGKRLAMAGVIVAGLAGFNSINDAIDNSVPAISAMNTALEMAQDSGNDDLAKMIEKDLSDAKVRLSSGKDLSYVAGLQEKYAKFMKTEGLAYESKLAVQLNQQLK